MRDLKFRGESSLHFKRRRSFIRSFWLIPALVLAAGALYAALQLHEDAPRNPASPATSPKEQTIRSVPLQLPSIPGDDQSGEATGTQEPPASSKAAPSPPVSMQTGKVHKSNVPAADTNPPTADTNPPTGDNQPSEKPADYGRWLTHTIEQGDTLSRIFKNFGLDAGLLHRIVHSSETAGQLACIKPGQIIRIRFDEEDRLIELIHEVDPVSRLKIARVGDDFSAARVEQPVETRSNEVSGVIENSLFGSAREAGLSDTMIMELAGIFGWDVDFALEIRTGDRFSVVFAEQWLDGKKLRDGPILAAEFVNQGKTYRAIRFETEKGQAGYYSPDGKSMRKAFLRAPVDFRRISSRFQRERWHPVLGKKRPHRGVDYAAAIGTPVKASGNGKVIFKGRKGGYGNTVIIKHGSKYTTLYAHLNGFRKGLKNGKRVSQGDVIGYVGRTGLATGPHLHYEFRVNGVHHNPLTVELPSAEPIAKRYRQSFRSAAEPLLARLDTLNRTMVADAIR